MAELDREPADVLVADCMLFTALIAGEARRIPTVALFHAAISGFRAGPLFEAFSQNLPVVNELRAELDLAPAASITDIHDACKLSLVAMPREFDLDIPLPETVRFVGPILDGPPINKAVEAVPVKDGREPLAVVSFSTSYQAQQGRLQEVVDALSGTTLEVVVTTGSAIPPGKITAGANVRVAGFAAHDRLLPKASVVVTHAGMGTVMAALSHGVPVVCVPMGRDQFFNAAMVDRLGVGRVVPPDAKPDVIRRTVDHVLADDDVREAAKRFAAVIAGYGGAADAVHQLERL
jgi:MGT family glycosyltransferase